MNNILDLLKTIDLYVSYLKKHNFKFDDNGYPIFTKEMFLNEEPEFIITFSNRNNKRVINREKTLICLYDKDKNIYPRFKKIFEEIDIYKDYLGVATSDITVTSDMDQEWQETIVLLNLLFGAVLAVNGIKIVLNTRLGSIKNIELFRNIPKNVMCISGFLGCDNIQEHDYTYLSKILYLLPEELLIYGKEDKIINKMLDILGINYRYYVDFHSLCKKGVI